MEKLFINIFEMSISASWLILAVLIVRFLLRKAPKGMRCFLWLLVGIRLLIPFSVESVFSLIPGTQAVDERIYDMEQPTIYTETESEAKEQPSVQNAYEPSVEKDTNKIQTLVSSCAKIWILGMALMIGYMAVSWLRLRHRLKTAVPMDFAVDEEHQTRIYQSDAIDSPFLFGILAPRIYIPMHIAGEELPYVILHEKTHRKRKDYLIKPTGFLLLSVYWFNPLVWAAYVLLCRDIELACDEKVIRELGEQCKKAYSQALLTSAVSRRMITACPVAFGEVGVRERVKNVLNYKKPAFWALVAAVLACIIVPVCFMTQKKNAENVADMEQTAGEYLMAVPDSEERVAVPWLRLDAEGGFTFMYSVLSSYLPYGSYEIKGNILTADTEDGLYHYQFTVTDSGSLVFDAAKSSEIPWTWDERLEVPLTDGAEFVKISETDASGHETDTVPTEEPSEQAGADQAAQAYIGQWAQAFCGRDGEAIADMADEKTGQELADNDFLLYGVDGGGQEYTSFGWSSPWPWGNAYDEESAERNYRIVNITDHSAEILYYAWVSDPHVTVWRELLTYEIEDDKFTVTSEELQVMDGICTSEEFYRAYPGGIISGTMMDYYAFNGAGEALNSHAVNNKDRGWGYEKLFEPDTAAVYLLNLLDNPNKVGIRTGVDGSVEHCTVRLEFYEFGTYVDVMMIQPYGPDGIWLPQSKGEPEQNTSTDSEAYVITGENIEDIMKNDVRTLETLFPDHHEPVSAASFPRNADLNGDGVEETIDLINLRYNGGDGGYALRVTDTRTGKQIPLPDGYTEESGFPIHSFFGWNDESRFLIQLGDEKRSTTIAAITIEALVRIYEGNGMYPEAKRTGSFLSDDEVRGDALSGCSIVTYNKEENPVIVLKTYVSGFMGHADTLGYVITELRLQKDNTWISNHYFLLDSCDDASVVHEELESVGNGGVTTLPYDGDMDIQFMPLMPGE